MLAPPTNLPVVERDDPRELINRQLAMLGRLAEAGLNIALAIEREATSPSPGPDEAPAGHGSDPALAYARVSRAVRLTLALQSNLLKDLRALDRGRFEVRRERRRKVERIVERVIRAEHDGMDGEAERLADEASERLEYDDIYGDLADRPVSEVVAEVCRDLGLSPDWAVLAEEAWARAEVEAGAACAPLAALVRPPPTCPPVSVLRPPDLRAASP